MNHQHDTDHFGFLIEEYPAPGTPDWWAQVARNTGYSISDWISNSRRGVRDRFRTRTGHVISAFFDVLSVTLVLQAVFSWTPMATACWALAHTLYRAMWFAFRPSRAVGTVAFFALIAQIAVIEWVFNPDVDFAQARQIWLVLTVLFTPVVLWCHRRTVAAIYQEVKDRG